MNEHASPLTDAMIERIEARLSWRGAKVAAARYAGISRQNLGKFFRERGVSRDSEVLLRLEEFSAWPTWRQRAYAGREDSAASLEPEKADRRKTVSSKKPEDAVSEEPLPPWLL